MGETYQIGAKKKVHTFSVATNDERSFKTRTGNSSRSQQRNQIESSESDRIFSDPIEVNGRGRLGHGGRAGQEGVWR